jgi:hypothetical protein
VVEKKKLSLEPPCTLVVEKKKLSLDPSCMLVVKKKKHLAPWGVGWHWQLVASVR